MSLQWALVAAFLYIEIAFIFLLLLPIISPKTWQKFFKSRFLASINSQSNIYFAGFLIILVLLFLDSIREMRKHATTGHEGAHYDTELQHSMRLFRAQRNFYIAGFALFLCLVIRRLVLLIANQALLQAQAESALKQAKSASALSQSLLTTNDLGNKPTAPTKEQVDGRDKQEEQIKNLQKELAESREELIKLRINSEAMKKQAASVSTEYDRLMKEHASLQRKVEISGDTRKDK